MRIIFFGSFQEFSAKILESLQQSKDIEIVGVVTTPNSPVSVLAKAYHLPVFTPEILDEKALTEIIKDKTIAPDFFITSGYRKLLPPSWLTAPRSGSLNLHFSLLPKYRGANPAEWAILLNESQTGITLITMSPEFDTGKIIYQHSIPIKPTDTRLSLYDRLYTLGAQELPLWLNRYHLWLQKQEFDCQTSLAPTPQPRQSPTPIVRQFTRDDGFMDWRIIQAALAGQKPDMSLLSPRLKIAHDFLINKKTSWQLIDDLSFITRAARALNGFPSLWTEIKTKKGQKRLKLLTVHCSPPPARLILDTVHLEGYQPATFNQIKNLIL